MSFNPLWLALIVVVLMIIWEIVGKHKSPKEDGLLLVSVLS